MWITLAATHHLFRDEIYLQTENCSSRWSPCFPSSYAIHTNAFETNIYVAYRYENIINTTIIRFYRTSLLLLWMLHITGWWHENTPSRMLPLLHYSFGTEDLDPVTLVIASEHVYTTLSTHLQVTHYANSLKKHYLDDCGTTLVVTKHQRHLGNTISQ